MFFRAGDLDRVVTFERQGAGRDALNAPSGAWATIPGLAAVRCQRMTVSQAERLRAAQVGGDVGVRLRTWWRPELAPVTLTLKERFTLDGVTYQVTGVEELGRRGGVEITGTRAA